MKTKKIAALACAALTITTLTGCSQLEASLDRPSNTEDRETCMEELLREKYGDTFTVQSLEKKLGQQAFSESYYVAQVSSDAYTGTFTAQVDEDFSHLEDNYPCLYWGDEIDQRAEIAAQALPASCNAQWKVVYLPSDGTWKDTDFVDDYLAHAKTYVHYVVTADEDDAIHAALALHDALKAENLQYNATWKVGEETIAYGEVFGETLTEKEVMAKFE